ncbi:MAG: hypothetical protein ACRD93_05255 [Nitrososphaeraceae archaeon]
MKGSLKRKRNLPKKRQQLRGSKTSGRKANNKQNLQLIFKYSRLGGGEAHYQISYSSKTKQLVTQIIPKGHTDIDKRNVRKKRLTKSQEKKIKEEINENGFFEAAGGYPSDSGESFLMFSLTVQVDHKIHTVSWTEIPTTVPSGLFRIAEYIENVAEIKSEHLKKIKSGS